MKQIAIFLALICQCGCIQAQDMVESSNQHFKLGIDLATGAVFQLKNAADNNGPNFVMSPAEYPEFSVPDSRWFGDIAMRYRVGGGNWKHAATSRSSSMRHVSKSNDANGGVVTVAYSGKADHPDQIDGFVLNESYWLHGDALTWRIDIKNQTDAPLEIGDLGLPLLFNTYYAKDPLITYQKRLVRHSYIEGDNSFIFWCRPDGIGPFLLMTPTAGTHLEYYNAHVDGDNADAPDKVFARRNAWEGLYTAYIHAGVQSKTLDSGGTWRQPITTRTLQPKGSPDSEASYEFTFHWESDYSAVRNELYKEGLIDIEVAPGMVIPTDLDAHFSLHTHRSISSIQAEFPMETTIEVEPQSDVDRSTYKLHFGHLGENVIRIRYGDHQQTELELFVIEPLEVLIKKRASFLVQRQQVHDGSKWYDGEFGQWDMRSHSLRTPDDVGDLEPYMVAGSDDPSLGKAPYIAAKNIIYPDATEVAAVENYIKTFVWGKLQRTDKETPYPFGVYGTPSWFELRNSQVGLNSGGNGREHMWRTFDYTHLIQLYFEMYRIATLYPDIVHYANASEYLMRAFGTAKAYFEIPYQIKMGEPWGFHGWTDWAFKQGNFHELFIPDLIDALTKEGRVEDARFLRIEWEKKVLYFLYDHPYPYGSEMYFDTTGFESTQAIAEYASTHAFNTREAIWLDKNSGSHYEHSAMKPEDVTKFEGKEVRANISARGSLETNYYQLGSDIRQAGNSNFLLSYMTEMGGWSLLEFASHNVYPRIDVLRIGYASYLAGWADINSGVPESNYGFWFPGKENDGAAGWGFNPQKVGTTWTKSVGTIDRGLWPFDGEIDNGFSGAIRAASVYVVSDPIFGLMAYGGNVRLVHGKYELFCRDGVRQKAFIAVWNQPIRIELGANHLSSTQPLRISEDETEVSMTIDGNDESTSATELVIDGMPTGQYELSIDGSATQRIEVPKGGRLSTTLRIPQGASQQIRLELERGSSSKSRAPRAQKR